jgi:hypothetical protein
LRKGQIFLILGIITVILLISLRASLNLMKILETKRYLEIGLERKEFQNIKDEVLKRVEISLQAENVTNKTEEFLSFSRDVMKERTMDFNSFLVQTIHPNVNAGTDTRLNVTVLNYLGANIQTLNLSFSYDYTANQSFSSVADRGRVDANFTFNTNSNTSYILTVYYSLGGEGDTENIIVPVEIGKSKLTGFFDLKLISNRGEHRDNFNKTYNIP